MNDLDKNQNAWLAAAGRAYQASAGAKDRAGHPEEEVLASYIDGVLSAREVEETEKHLAACSACRELVALAASPTPETAVAEARATSLARLQSLLASIPSPAQTFRMLIELVQDGLRVIDTNGLALAPAPVVIRSAGRRDAQRDLTHEYAFPAAQVKLEVRRESGDACRLSIHVSDPVRKSYLPQVRATLFRGKDLLESNVGQRGPVVFESVKAGAYRIELKKGGTVIGSVELALAKST